MKSLAWCLAHEHVGNVSRSCYHLPSSTQAAIWGHLSLRRKARVLGAAPERKAGARWGAWWQGCAHGDAADAMKGPRATREEPPWSPSEVSEGKQDVPQKGPLPNLKLSRQSGQNQRKPPLLGGLGKDASSGHRLAFPG